MADCKNLQKSLGWCQGTPVLPGVKRKLYYIAKTSIVSFPELPRDSQGRATSATYEGSFVLADGETWKYIDTLPDKNQLTSEAQGELPSQTQLNKLTAVHPGVGEEASAAAAYINNTDNVFIIEDMLGNFRVVGSDKWQTKNTVAQDLGQGPTGTASTTISVEASDEVPAPFYTGEIVTEDGTINPEQIPELLGWQNISRDTLTVLKNNRTHEPTFDSDDANAKYEELGISGGKKPYSVTYTQESYINVTLGTETTKYTHDGESVMVTPIIITRLVAASTVPSDTISVIVISDSSGQTFTINLPVY